MQSTHTEVKRLFTSQIRRIRCLEVWLFILLVSIGNLSWKAKSVEEYVSSCYKLCLQDPELLAGEFIALSDYLLFLDQQESLSSSERDQQKQYALENYPKRQKEFKENCQDVSAYLQSWVQEEDLKLIEHGTRVQKDGDLWAFWLIEGADSGEKVEMYFQLIPLNNGWKLGDGFYEGGIP